METLGQNILEKWKGKCKDPEMMICSGFQDYQRDQDCLVRNRGREVRDEEARDFNK